MNDTSGQFFGETSLAEPTRLTILWDEGAGFNIEVLRKSRVNTRLHSNLMDLVELLDQRKPGSYAEFLRRSC